MRTLWHTSLAAVFASGVACSDSKPSASPDEPTNESIETRGKSAPSPSPDKPKSVRNDAIPESPPPAPTDEQRDDWRKGSPFVDHLLRQAKLGPSVAQVRGGKLHRDRLAVLFLVLQNTRELHVHQQRGASKNQVFVHSSGKELVKDEHGKEVTDFNKGTYNYANPKSQPLSHFTYDMLPWMALGSSRTDPTSREERIEAFSKDLMLGVRDAQRQRHRLPKLPVDKWKHPSQSQALAVMAQVFSKGNAEVVYRYVAGDSPLTETALETLRRNVVTGLRRTIPRVEL